MRMQPCDVSSVVMGAAKKAAGVYALSIQGDIPVTVVDMAEQAGVQPVMRSS